MIRNHAPGPHTGDPIFHEGKWHLFACTTPAGKQRITHYISPDGSLDHWELQKEDTFGPDGVIYHASDWRDPRVAYCPVTRQFRMLLAARVNEDHTRTGCIGLCVSRDLKHWEYRRPEYYPGCFDSPCEHPDIFTLGGWEYLIFSADGTCYAKRPLGSSQWQLPDNHRLDGRSFCAARTASSGGERYLFGFHTGDRGGDPVIHRLRQLPGGDLGLCPPESLREFFRTAVLNRYYAHTSGWSLTSKGLRSAPGAAPETVLMQKLPAVCRIRADIRSIDARCTGIILHTDREMVPGCALLLEPDRGRLIFRSRISEDTQSLETPIPKSPDGRYRLEIFADGSAFTAYVNDTAALSFRLPELQPGYLGLFAQGQAVFEDIEMRI